MLRVVLSVTSLLILGVLVMQHAVTLPRGNTLPLADHVDQGIPLATIDLHAADQPLTVDEMTQGAQWWQRQPQALLDQLTEVLRKERNADGWTSLYVSATADGGHVLVIVGNQGRLGTIRFAGDATLLACDTTPDEVLPIILPSVAGGFRRPSAGAVHDLAKRLRYLREASPVAWSGNHSLDPIPMLELNVESAGQSPFECECKASSEESSATLSATHVTTCGFPEPLPAATWTTTRRQAKSQPENVQEPSPPASNN